MTWGESTGQQPLEYYVAGEAYPRRAIAVAPDIVACHCLLVRILVGAQRHAEAVAAMEATLELPTPSEAFAWSYGLVVDATECAAKALDALNRDDDKGPLVKKVIELYPHLEPLLSQVRRLGEACSEPARGREKREGSGKRPRRCGTGNKVPFSATHWAARWADSLGCLMGLSLFCGGVPQAGWNRERMQLWTEGKAMMDREPKDWALGQRLFGRLATLEPKRTLTAETDLGRECERPPFFVLTPSLWLGPFTDFWTLLQAAACFTYGSGNAAALLKQGEAYARQTIDIDPTSAGGYGILARNLNLQVRRHPTPSHPLCHRSLTGPFPCVVPCIQGRHAEVIALATALVNCRHDDTFKIFVLDSVRCFRIGAFAIPMRGNDSGRHADGLHAVRQRAGDIAATSVPKDQRGPERVPRGAGGAEQRAHCLGRRDRDRVTRSGVLRHVGSAM